MPVPPSLILRLVEPSDDWEALTDLLHRAYGALAARGLRFYASHQPVTVTRQRAAKGECWIGLLDGQIVATITLVPPDRCEGAPWYDRPEVAKFNQLAVEPALGGQGIGRHLIELVERRARAAGAEELALDTAEGAEQLIALYTSLGYRFIETVDWRPDTNYLSRIYSKRL